MVARHRINLAVLRISDDVTIMRDGQWVATRPAKELTMDEIIRLMVGRPLTNRFPPKDNVVGTEDILKVEGLTAEYSHLKDASIHVRKGEILGVAGLDSSGRTELLENIFGSATRKSGKIYKNGKLVGNKTPRESIKNGFALVTEERRATGILGILDIRANTVIASLKKYLNGPFLSDKKMAEATDSMIKAMRIKTPSQQTKINTLSGGNQQKVIFGRWILTQPDVLLHSSGGSMAAVLQQLQGVFDLVRLVDPERAKVLTLHPDGTLEEQAGHCHVVWNKAGRCENCISAKAYARKTILNKIEFKDEEAYFVISKYIEVGGRGCMLEMVTRLTDGRWLDMGGHRLLLDRCDGMERSAFVDPLTGAYTRRYFDKFLAGGEMHGGVAMIDVNQFKSVNDSFGHLVGDEALQTVAAAMQSCLRQTDILIRYGGDEFLLLMPQNCPDGVESVIRRVQNAVQAARVPSHPELRLSVSIGGVCNVQPLTEAIRQADARMYCNKENGEPVL